MMVERPDLPADWISADEARAEFGLDEHWLDIKNSTGVLKGKKVVFGTVFYLRSEVQRVRMEDVLSACQTRYG